MTFFYKLLGYLPRKVLKGLPDEVKYRTLADAIAEPPSNGSSTHGRSWKIGASVVALSELLTQAIPAIVYEQKERTQARTLEQQVASDASRQLYAQADPNVANDGTYSRIESTESAQQLIFQEFNIQDGTLRTLTEDDEFVRKIQALKGNGELKYLARGNVSLGPSVGDLADYLIGLVKENVGGDIQNNWYTVPPNTNQRVQINGSIERICEIIFRETGLRVNPDGIDEFSHIKYKADRIYNIGLFRDKTTGITHPVDLNTGEYKNDLAELLRASGLSPKGILGVNYKNSAPTSAPNTTTSPEHDGVVIRGRELFDLGDNLRLIAQGNLENIFNDARYAQLPIRFIIAYKPEGRISTDTSIVDRLYSFRKIPRNGGNNGANPSPTPTPTPTPQLVVVSPTANLPPVSLTNDQTYNLTAVVAGVNNPSSQNPTYALPLNLEWIIIRESDERRVIVRSSGIVSPTVSLSFPPEELMESVPPGGRVLMPGNYRIDLTVTDASGLVARISWGRISVFASSDSGPGGAPGGAPPGGGPPGGGPGGGGPGG